MLMYHSLLIQIIRLELEKSKTSIQAALNG